MNDQMARQASIKRILKYDYSAGIMTWILIVVPFVFAIFGFLFIYMASQRHLQKDLAGMKEEMSAVGIAVIILIFLATIPLLFWRIRSLKKIVEEGTLTWGIITSIYFSHRKGRGCVEYRYKYQTRTATSRNYVWQKAGVKEWRQGQEVLVAVDPANPTRALIASLYLTEESFAEALAARLANLSEQL